MNRLLLALFMAITLSACGSKDESSTEAISEHSPLGDTDNGLLGPIRKIENDAGKMPNIKGDNYNKLMGYGGIIARAKACGINTEDEQRRVSNWIDQNTAPGTVDNQAWHISFSNMIAFWGTETDPKDCEGILLTYSEVIPWPE